ncbi:MAG TPA: phosphatase PAP2 family protein [Rhodoglobus sp.]|nr:phosphatase PAP2 family protein [Rhodoglobus sp.]
MTTHEPAPVERRAARRWPWVSGGVGILLVLALGALVALRTSPLELDAEWMDEIVEHRGPVWEIPSQLMNFLGGGWFSVFAVPLGLGILLVMLRKPWSALFLVLTLAVSAGLVQVLKSLFGRARPEQILVTADFGSFPSGHTANAATLAVVFGLLAWRWWVWAIGALYVVLMALSRTYLGAHWVTDTVAGALLGAAVAILVWAPFAVKLRSEWSRPDPDR